MQQPLLKSITTLVTVNLVLCTASFLILEVALRWTGFSHRLRPQQVVGYGLAPRYYYRPDPINGYDIAENFRGGDFALPDYIDTFHTPFKVSSNAAGCRDRDTEAAVLGNFVLLLGDSFTWGYAALEDTWGSVLEDRIGTRVLKCGVGGYGPRHERRKLETIVTKVGRPRVIVVGYCIGNDLLDDYVFPGRTVVDGYMVTKVEMTNEVEGERKTYTEAELRARLNNFFTAKPAGPATRIKVLLAEHSILYNLFRDSRWLRGYASQLGMAEPPPSLTLPVIFQPQETYPWLQKAWEDHLHNLKELKRAADAVEAQILFVLIPVSEQVYGHSRQSEKGKEWEYPNRKLAAFFAEEGIACLDLLPEFRSYADRRSSGQSIIDLYWPRDPHLNLQGNRLTGLLVGRYFLEHEVSGGPDRVSRLSAIQQELSTFGH